MTREDVLLLLDAAMCLEIVAFYNHAGDEVHDDLRDALRVYIVRLQRNLAKLLEE